MRRGRSPWYKKYGEVFPGKIIPFGCGVYFKPMKWSPISKAAPAMSFGIFMGYRLAPGGKWNGEYLVADLDDFALGADPLPSLSTFPSVARQTWTL